MQSGLGVGGGAIIVPVLVQLGFNARSATATSSLLLIYLSGAAIILSLVNETI